MRDSKNQGFKDTQEPEAKKKLENPQVKCTKIKQKTTEIAFSEVRLLSLTL